ncbi:cobyric acid synthase [Garciella nitratireducens]|uniref:cobyric acid synthase n=1 Tax=Garciella nitratireducens TaxID=218205 RepID=UPI000DFC1EF1|nr:cobyric acid synthase [Garciella nitratireducens]RBP41551.1 adenosylcobyric acid synthase (glutamine-hydrolysing) [Garciella nitratireducens]
MLLGTGSSVGKSTLTAALCRIFYNEGYKVAPFKAQNMALNSFVTKDGKEMGRAQVVQAEAAGIEPRVEMNPILMKPITNIGSQIILNGKVYKNLTACEYYLEKDFLKAIVMNAYKVLSSQYELVFIEGAGGCAEINLRDKDIVNMGFAEMIDAPVILVGDIDKGGVFASLYGSVMLLGPDDRKRIQGFIINKFRGDKNLLIPGIKMLEEKIGIPCLGIVPYVDLNIDEEDSLTSKFEGKKGKGIHIGIIKLPHISNFSDFTPLEMEEDINLSYITSKGQIEDVDLLIIPGTKSTIEDMHFIYEKGIHKDIYQKYQSGAYILGICGGYQMLGKEIVDPNQMESSHNIINGLGLLNIKTIITKEKSMQQVQGKVISKNGLLKNLENQKLWGYEIHMGKTQFIGKTIPAIELENGTVGGIISSCGKILGTYLHGIFENDIFRREILNHIRKEKNLEILEKEIDYKKEREKEYEKLASVVSKNLDLKKIKEILEL